LHPIPIFERNAASTSRISRQSAEIRTCRGSAEHFDLTAAGEDAHVLKISGLKMTAAESSAFGYNLPC